jgi:hypothetical protein
LCRREAALEVSIQFAESLEIDRLAGDPASQLFRAPKLKDLDCPLKPSVARKRIRRPAKHVQVLSDFLRAPGGCCA